MRAGAVGRGAAHAAHEPAVHRPAGGAAAVPGRSAAAAGAGQGSRTARRRSTAILALADAQPTRGAADAGGRAGLPGAGAGLIRADLRDVRGSDVIARSGGVVVAVRRQPGRARFRCWPATTPGCWPRPGPPGPPDLRRGRSGPPEHHEPADRRAGRRGRAAAAGHLPAARDLAGRLRGAARAGHVHARGRDQLLPAARRPGRRAGAGRRGRGGQAARGGPALMIPLAVLEEVIDASGVAPRIEAMLPSGVRARQLTVRTLLAGMCLAQADHRPAHLTRVHQALTACSDDDQAAARRDRGLETRPAPADLPADRVYFRPGRGRPRQGRTRRAALRSAAAASATTCSRHPSRRSSSDASTLAGGGLDGHGDLLPPARRPKEASAPTPRPPGGTARTTCCAAETSCSSATTCPPRIMMPDENGPPVPELARRATLSPLPARPGPRPGPRPDRDARRGIPLGDILADSGYAHRDAAAWALPLRAGRRLGSSRTCTRTTADPRAPTRARSSQREPVLPGTPRSLLELGPLARDASRENRSSRTTRRPPSWPATSSAGSPLTTPTATTGSQCPAAMGKIRCPLRPASMALDRDRPEILQPPASTRRPAAPGRPSPSRPRSTPRPRRNTTTPRSAPPLLRPPHRRRTRLRHRQGPRHHRHRPRLVPPHGPGPPHAVHHHPAHRPQPAHPDRLERPAGRKPAPRRHRAPPRTRRRRRKTTLATLTAAPP